MAGVPEYALERLCDAPSELAWQCWTDPALFSRWYAPGVETRIHKMDVQPGGECLIELRLNGTSLYQKFQYLEVTPHENLTWLLSITNDRWEPAPSAFAENWPQNLLTTLKLESHDHDNKIFHLSLTPFEANDLEINSFKKARLAIDAGWNAGFDVLDQILVELKGR